MLPFSQPGGSCSSSAISRISAWSWPRSGSEPTTSPSSVGLLRVSLRMSAALPPSTIETGRCVRRPRAAGADQRVSRVSLTGELMYIV